MKMLVTWDERMVFTAAAAGCTAMMDAKAPIGQGTALTPKELVVAGLCGCAAMDVIALMRKHKQAVTTFEVKAEVTTSEGGPPVVFTSAELEFALAGQVDPALALEAVRLSQTHFCGVTAMLVKAFPIRYRVLVNGTLAGEGQADFGSPG
jgi:putative redox protein